MPSDYKRKILETVKELKKAIKEEDKMHEQILWDRLERQILGKSYY
jgi:hypothetical protein